MKIKLYIEGGGDSALQDTLFREGWQTFFQKAGLAGRMLKRHFAEAEETRLLTPS